MYHTCAAQLWSMQDVCAQKETAVCVSTTETREGWRSVSGCLMGIEECDRERSHNNGGVSRMARFVLSAASLPIYCWVLADA